MKGLLIKDLKLLKNQKVFFAVMFIFAVLMAFTSGDGLFVVMYCTLLGAFFSLSTISYDEYGNGYPFLFTLPVTRKKYALEKYLFGFLTGGSIWLAATLMELLLNPQWRENTSMWLAVSMSVFLVLMIMLLVMIPVQLKFGSEKGRIFMIIVVVIGIVGIQSFLSIFKEINLEAGITFLVGLPVGVLVALALLVFVLAGAISMAVSIRIVEKKEF